MAIRAYVTYASYGAALHVSLVQVNEADETIPRRVLRLEQHGEGEGAFTVHTWEQVDPAESTRPTLTLGHEEANALLRGLAEFYGGVDDQRALRRDYDNERGRVDKLIGALIDSANGGVRHG
jgi:hypothetical protein